jgi:2,3,4,5-tetrahydropyridine-2-carboxylate N-succinyltransferase
VGLYEGVVVGYRAVVAAGVVLTASSAIYDLTTGEVIRADPSRGLPLVVPAGAVVVPGTRPAEGGFARRHSLALVTPVIVKRRDRKTDAKVALEAALRGAG